MKKFFKQSPINQLLKVDTRRYVFAIGDINNTHLENLFQKNGILFKTYYSKSGYWIGYYLKHEKNLKVVHTNNYIVFKQRKREKEKPYNVKIIYQDKECRFLEYCFRNEESDFIFMLKGSIPDLKEVSDDIHN